MTQERRIPNLRSSSIKMFGQCPRQWRHEYLEGQRSESGKFALIGTAAHETVDNYLSGRFPHPELDPSLAGVTDPAERKATVDYCLAREGKRTRLIGTEMRCEIEYAPGIFLEITIDAAYEHPDGSIEIEDHKTNRALESTEEWAAKIQQRLYAAFARRYLWPGRKIRMTIGLVTQGAERTWVPDPAYDVDLWRLVDESMAGMLAATHPETPGEHCRFCPRAKQCRSYGETLGGLADRSVFTRDEGPGARYLRLKGLEKILEAEIALAKEELTERLEKGGELVDGGKRWALVPSTRRIAPAFSTLWSALTENGQDQDAIAILFELCDEVFSVKLGGIDSLAGRGETLRRRLQGLAPANGKLELSDRPVDGIVKK